jgi:hypothetical protein
MGTGVWLTCLLARKVSTLSMRIRWHSGKKKPAQGAGESILLEGGGDKRNYNDIFPLKKILIGNT